MPLLARLASLAFVLPSVSSSAVAAQPAGGGFTLQQVMSALQLGVTADATREL
jgi:hypothetical protein